MTNRYHAKDYTAEEIASMEGPVLIWLALQGLGYRVEDNKALNYTLRLNSLPVTAYWRMGQKIPTAYSYPFEIHPVSVLNQLRRKSYQPQLFVNDAYKWECAIIIDHAEFGSGIADSIGTAVARALAEKARREQGNG